MGVLKLIFFLCLFQAILNTSAIRSRRPHLLNRQQSQCGSPKYANDGHCDDDNNNEGCNWDNGACCGENVDTSYCTECKCLDPKALGKSGAAPASTCGLPGYALDDHCDDENNNEGCNWDNGACCGDNVNTKYCKECQCLDPSAQGKSGTPDLAQCGSPGYATDTHCDDDNNNEGCGWDNGACCGENVDKSYCTECKCLDPKEQGKDGSMPTSECGLPDFADDDHCDDENNNEGCKWDNGACCGDNVSREYCKECECKDPNYSPGENTGCGAPNTVGDGYCDDENNNEGCNWDNGDCCGDNVLEDYCNECECKDPDAQGETSPCGAPGFETDDYCDDTNNNEACNWDGGACCGENVIKEYCQECECKDPDAQGKNTGCGAPDFAGDGHCDDDNNNEACNWDDGDCCGDNVSEEYCQECECKDPNYSPPPTVADPCGAPGYETDEYCDDNNNNEACYWDGGACCGNSAVNWNNYCADCTCKDPNYSPPPPPPTVVDPTPAPDTEAPPTPAPATPAPATEAPATAAPQPTPPPTAAPPVVTPSPPIAGWEPYPMLDDSYCGKAARYGGYNDLDAAEDACDADTECIAVYNTKCEGNAFELCKTSVVPVLKNSYIDSCVYPKAPVTALDRPANRFLSFLYME